MRGRGILFIIGGLILISLPFFIHLDKLPLMLYDESRLAVNAQEMTQKGDWLVTRFAGEPDNWQVKPPLTVWLQALSMKILGYDVLAVRLPSAIAGLFTACFLLWFGFNVLKKYELGLIAGLVLASIPGYVGYHIARTGDYDALLSLFTTAYVLCFWAYVHSSKPEQSRKYIYATAAFVILAIMTKSIAGLMFMPAMAIYLLIRKKVSQTLRNKHFYLATMTVIIIPLSYYLAREIISPDYLRAVYEVEILRYTQTVEQHQYSFLYYFEGFQNRKRLITWVFILPLSLLTYLQKDQRLKHLLSWLYIASGSYLLIISLSQTKLEWYDAPLFPLFALLISLGLYSLHHLTIARIGQKKRLASGIIISLLLSLYLLLPYKRIMKKVFEEDYQDAYNWRTAQYGPFMEHLGPEDHYVISHVGYNATVAFYLNKFIKEGKDVIAKYPGDLIPGERVIICENDAKEILFKKYHYDTIKVRQECLYLEIQSEK